MASTARLPWQKKGTGVPGAGKTLVGLNVATRHGSRDDAAHAVFLSGNGRGGGLAGPQAASTSW